MEGDTPQPKDEKPTEHINLKVKGQDGNEIFFKIKKTTPLRRLIDAYEGRQGITKGHARFLFDGRRIDPNSTPNELDMEENDQIEVMMEQTGGSTL